MNKKNVLLLFFLSSNLFAVTNKTFFMSRPVLQDVVLLRAMRDYFINHKETDCGFNISGKVFYEESTDSNDLAKYFLFNNKTTLNVKGLGVADQTNKDVAAEWLSIASNADTDNPYPADNDDYTFSSKIKISPKYKQFGLYLGLEKELPKSFYLSAFLPFVQVETTLKLREYCKENERIPASVNKEFLNTIHNAIEGLNNPLMKYGKMSTHWQRLAGLADLKILLGRYGKLFKSHLFNIYAQATFPTGYKPRAEYVFEPILGNGQHYALGFGGWLDFKLCNKINWLNNLDYEYLFESTEKRSFDLCSNGPWSRYLLATNNKVNDHPIPMINFLTKDLKITPGSRINLLSALHFNYKKFDLEVGYNFYWKDSEQVKLKSCWNEKINVAAFEDLNLENFDNSYFEVAENYSAKKINSSIADDFDDLIDFVAINSNNLNILSVVCPQSYSNKLYLSIGCSGFWYKNFANINIGASYEFAEANKLLSKWSIWLGCNLQI